MGTGQVKISISYLLNYRKLTVLNHRKFPGKSIPVMKIAFYLQRLIKFSKHDFSSEKHHSELTSWKQVLSVRIDEFSNSHNKLSVRVAFFTTWKGKNKETENVR